MSKSPGLVLIGGPSGAGKSFFAEALRQDLGEEQCVLIAIDDYYHDLSDLSAEQRAARDFDHPAALDWELLIEHVRALRSGRAIEAPRYDFASHLRLPESQSVEPRPHILVEGIHALTHDALVALAAVSVFVHAPRAVCLERRLARDVAERGRDRESVMRRFEESVWPMAEAHVLPSRERAEVIVSPDASIRERIAAIRERIDVRAKPN